MLKGLLKFLSKNTMSTKPQKESNTGSKSNRKISSDRIGEIGEYKIHIQLDQLPDDCKCLSDIMIQNSRSRTGYSQIDHLIIHPFGIFVIETKNYTGQIRGKKEYKYWYVNSKFRMYNPLRQNYGHIKALEKKLKGFSPLVFISIVSFNMRARFNVSPELRKIESNELVVYDVELSEYISRKINRLKATNSEPKLDREVVDRIYNVIKDSNITDIALREEHVRSLNKPET